jgi:hypothetical protein
VTDEKFVYTQDVRDKKITARSARNKRTHTGKGGAVKLPSDYMTRKELNAMNGEVQSYRLNEPMCWKEFKKMPDDIKVVYINALRQKFGVSDSKIAKMLCAAQPTLSYELRRLGIGVGRNTGRKQAFNKEGWLRWCNGVPPVAEVVEEVEADPVYISEAVEAPVVCDNTEKLTPCGGSLSFEGNADAALNTVGVLLHGVKVRINIAWEMLDNG